MIDWQEHSTSHERVQLANELDSAMQAVHQAGRDQVKALARLSRQKKPASVITATRELEVVQHRLAQAQATHDAAVRTMCHVHIDINLDDIVELVYSDGRSRKRAPIIVEGVEFNREPDGSFWLRIAGVLFEESTTGRPQIRQGFDLREFDPQTRVVKHN